MKKSTGLLLIAFTVILIKASAQNQPKIAHYFGEQVIIDSSSTMLIPTLYNVSLFSSSKVSFWDDYFANIVFYNFKTDSSKTLFKEDTYILGFNAGNYSSNAVNLTLNKSKSKTTGTRSIFYRVRAVDHNKNGRIDAKDPVILYVSDVHGNNLKALTTENENVIAIDIYEKQNMALLKIQRDFDKDNDFESEDKDFYFLKLDLATLTFGNKIELK
jgi:hypothetical protein